MNKKDKVLHWLSISEYDIESAEVMLDTGRYTYAAFMCQQAVEKAVKALYIYVLGEEAPKTHNISTLLKAITINESVEQLLDTQKFQEEYQERADLFIDLLTYYIKTRYPDYKEKVSKLLGKNHANYLMNESRRCLEWIKSLIKLE